MNVEESVSIVGSMLFASGSALPTAEICRVLQIDVRTAEGVIERLRGELERSRLGIRIVFVAEGYEMTTDPENARYVSRLEHVRERAKLSSAAMETLAVVAYRQPVTRGEVELVRGVNSEHVLATLLERGMVHEVGRKETLGRPILYGTTAEFLDVFGLESLAALPAIDDREEIVEGLQTSPPGENSVGD